MFYIRRYYKKIYYTVYTKNENIGNNLFDIYNWAALNYSEKSIV